uniref:Contryphan Le925 n=1 Tax=Conus leopardus TaxID=101306 RepID=COW_CONLE|nr:RecName: Full=Contryphan Le925; Contains: RecName: Full=Contryphan Le851; Contains: RecName: Full=Contryphan Le755; Contains: RecName: Full=Contryphan Le685 [Conus leopardus]
CFISDCAPG